MNLMKNEQVFSLTWLRMKRQLINIITQMRAPQQTCKKCDSLPIPRTLLIKLSRVWNMICLFQQTTDHVVQDSNLFINLWFLAGFRDINQSETQQNSSSLTNILSWHGSTFALYRWRMYFSRCTFTTHCLNILSYVHMILTDIVVRGIFALK